MAWYIFYGLWIWPDFLSYFNETIGGPKNGYKYLRDSNIDWGQDLPALAKYMKRKGMDKVKLYYFGTAKPEYYDIDWIPISKQEMDKPGRNVYAVSVHFLDRVRWTKYYKPADRIGYSIFIYDMKEAKLQG